METGKELSLMRVLEALLLLLISIDMHVSWHNMPKHSILASGFRHPYPLFQLYTGVCVWLLLIYISIFILTYSIYLSGTNTSPGPYNTYNVLYSQAKQIFICQNAREKYFPAADKTNISRNTYVASSNFAIYSFVCYDEHLSGNQNVKPFFTCNNCGL